jgi:hypothetical protein
MAARNMEEEQSLRECEAYVQMHDIQKILKAIERETNPRARFIHIP